MSAELDNKALLFENIKEKGGGESLLAISFTNPEPEFASGSSAPLSSETANSAQVSSLTNGSSKKRARSMQEDDTTVGVVEQEVVAGEEFVPASASTISEPGVASESSTTLSSEVSNSAAQVSSLTNNNDSGEESVPASASTVSEPGVASLSSTTLSSAVESSLTNNNNGSKKRVKSMKVEEEVAREESVPASASTISEPGLASEFSPTLSSETSNSLAQANTLTNNKDSKKRARSIQREEEGAGQESMLASASAITSESSLTLSSEVSNSVAQVSSTTNNNDSKKRARSMQGEEEVAGEDSVLASASTISEPGVASDPTLSSEVSTSVARASSLTDNNNDSKKRARSMQEYDTPVAVVGVASKDLLLLILGLDEKFRAPPNAWEYLTIRDLVNLSMVSKSIRNELRQVEYTKCRDGKDYLVPFPGYPGLLSTSSDLKIGAGLFPHQLASLKAMHRAENSSQAFGALRGGILGDAPGLGKTITMLALIASTAGTRPVSPREFWDQSAIREGWNALRTNAANQSDILKTLRPIRMWIINYVGKKSDVWKIFKSVETYVSPCYKDDRLGTIREFELYVTRKLRHHVPTAELELFRRNVLDLKEGLDRKNRKFLKSNVGRRLTMERRLVTTCATLIVVPDALLEHWFQQIHKHLNLRVFSDEHDDILKAYNSSSIRGVVYLDGIGDLADVADAWKPLRNITLQSQVPQPWQLSKFLVVITTFSRIQGEFQREVDMGRMEAVGRKQKSRKRHWGAVDCGTGSLSPLLQLRWLRVVVDEGHELGTHEAGSGVTSFINKLAAERRWVLSGTPTTGDEDDKRYTEKALDQLQRLLFFLRHPIYGNLPPTAQESKEAMGDDETQIAKQRMTKAKSNWETNVKSKFLSKKKEGKQELSRVLKEIMVMHRKEDIQLPQPIFRQAEASVWIPDEIQQKLRDDPTTSIQELDSYLHSPDFQSLVDKTQAAHIAKAVKDARQQLIDQGGSSQVKEKHTAIAAYEHMGKRDLRPIKAVVYSPEKNNLLSVTEFLLRMFNQENIAEMYESPNIGDMSAELSRFRHGFRECKKCPICRKVTDVSSARKAAQCYSDLLEVVTTSEPRTRLLIEPERIKRAINVPLARMEGLGALSSYSEFRRFWRVGDVLEIDIRDPHPVLAPRSSEETWKTFGSAKCEELAAMDFYQGRDWYFGPLPKQETDYVEVELVKWQPCSRFHSHARWYSGPRLTHVPVERIEEDVCVLSLDAKLSHGLDLSFVTHLFLLDAIDDAAQLEQVTSRAHRLGATGPVIVETVNTFYNLSNETQNMIDAILQNNEERNTKEIGSTDILIHQNKEKTLCKVVCQHCYRQFHSHAVAEEHERTNCPRNPENWDVVDPYHLSSIYSEIRPPPAILTKTSETVSSG